MSKIKATRPVLYQNRLYNPGEELPQHDPVIVKAWLAAGSAKEAGSKKPASSKPKAATTSGKARAQGKKAPSKGSAK